jgi:hypothetical protein
LVVLDREPEQLIGSPFDSCSRFIKSNSQSRARPAGGLSSSREISSGSRAFGAKLGSTIGKRTCAISCEGMEARA